MAPLAMGGCKVNTAQRADLVDALRSELELLVEMHRDLNTLIKTGTLDGLPNLWRHGDELSDLPDSAMWAAITIRANIESHLRYERERKLPR